MWIEPNNLTWEACNVSPSFLGPMSKKLGAIWGLGSGQGQRCSRAWQSTEWSNTIFGNRQTNKLSRTQSSDKNTEHTIRRKVFLGHRTQSVETFNTIFGNGPRPTNWVEANHRRQILFISPARGASHSQNTITQSHNYTNTNTHNHTKTQSHTHNYNHTPRGASHCQNNSPPFSSNKLPWT